MRTSNYFTSLLATLALATPAPLPGNPNERPSGGKCINQSEAQEHVDCYIAFFERKGNSHGNATAIGEALIADTFAQYSYSIHSARGTPISDRSPNGGLVKSSKAQFLERVLKNPDLPPRDIRTLAVLAACVNGESRIVWHWQFGSVGAHAADAVPVRGFALFDVVRGNGRSPWQIERMTVEFDSVAWVSDTVV